VASVVIRGLMPHPNAPALAAPPSARSATGAGPTGRRGRGHRTTPDGWVTPPDVERVHLGHGEAVDPLRFDRELRGTVDEGTLHPSWDLTQGSATCAHPDAMMKAEWGYDAGRSI
jgi:hypothetical protein